MTVSLGAILLGLVLGARHAFEPDHLAAVSVLSAESPGPKRGALLGLFWGVGHSLALLIVGLALAGLSAQMPQEVADLLELGVALMLIVLGVRGFVKAVRRGQEGPTQLHHHGHSAHVHSGPAEHVHVGSLSLATRPLVVGMMHGLAGSGAMTAMLVAELPTLAGRVAFMVLFGFGSILGMAAISGLAGWPLARLGRRPLTAKLVFAGAGATSAVFGAFWGWPLVTRLFA